MFEQRQQNPITTAPAGKRIARISVDAGEANTVISSIKVPVGTLCLVEATVFGYCPEEGTHAAYVVTAAAKNVEGTTALVGTPDVVALEDTATWVCSIVAHNDTDTLRVTVTPDATEDTTTIYSGEWRIKKAVSAAL